MCIVLNGLEWNGVLAYLDNVIVYASTSQVHLERLNRVLVRLIDSGLTVKPSNCQLFKYEIRFLGHVVLSAGIK